MKLPVIASPTEAYDGYVQNGVNGFIAATDEDWERHIEFLFCNHERRRVIGECGHRKAVENYSVETIARRMLQVFSDDGLYAADMRNMR